MVKRIGRRAGSGKVDHQEVESLHADELHDGVAGGGNTITSLWGNEGERIVLDSVTSAPVEMTSTSTEYVEVYDNFQRSMVDWSPIDYTNIGNLELTHGFYFFSEQSGDGTAYLRLSSAGEAPRPIPGTEDSVIDGNYSLRHFITTPLDNVDEFGEWTPMPEIRSEGTGECGVSGQHSVILTGEIL